MRIVIFALLVAFGFNLSGQVRPKQHDWIFYDISYDYMLNSPDGLEQRWRSNGHAISLMDDVAFGESNLGIGYGLGFMSNNYYSNLGIFTDFGSGDEQTFLLEGDSIESNKFTVQHIFVPLELRWRSDLNEDRNFWRVYLGARIGVRVRGYSELETEKVDVQFEKLGILSRFNYGVYARIGYDHFSLFASYGLSEIFREGEVISENKISKLTDIRALSVGFSLSL